jgi:hypothetical protein
MSYLDLYRKGECAQVWCDLQLLGPAVRQEPNLSDARAVAAETMERVRRNCERIIARLQKAGYKFGVYPDGSSGYYTEGALVPPTKATREDVATLEEQVGPLPLSLAAFWQEVGSVDFVGMHPARLTGLDPLVVYPPEAALSELDMSESEAEVSQFEATLAPDDLHKDNVSGGSPYAASLPDPSADFMFLNERHNLLFVPYLRLAILQWGGFPGLDAQVRKFDLLETLIADLEPF